MATDEFNAYEQRQAERKSRLEEAADRARKQSDSAYNQARSMASVIPMGQPILVGHHSEGRDRRYRARIWKKQDQACELAAKAKHFQEKAASVGAGGISSDDPQAVVKLKAELAALEERHSLMLATNAAHKAFLRDPATLDSSTLPDSIKAKIRDYKPAYSWEPHPIPPYRLTNNSANIRRIRGRIEQLQAAPTDTTERQEGEVTIREDATENRVMLIFPGKPSDEVRAILKSAGFKWSPNRGAWVRFLNNAGRAAAQYVLSKIKGAQ